MDLPPFIIVHSAFQDNFTHRGGVSHVAAPRIGTRPNEVGRRQRRIKILPTFPTAREPFLHSISCDPCGSHLGPCLCLSPISMALLDRPLFNLVSVSSSSSSSFDRWGEPNGWTHSDGRRCMQHARLIPSYPIRPSVPSGGRLRSFGVRVVCKGLAKKWSQVW